MTDLHPQTAAVRAGVETDLHHGAVIPPIHLSTTFTFPELNRKPEYDYSRSGNPTRDTLASALASLERGAGATVTSSGMAAVHVVLQLLRQGDRVLAPHDCYGGTHRLLRALAERGIIDVRTADLTRPGSLRPGVFDGVRMVWVETPSNPLLRISDIRRIAALASKARALLVVDNTFLSPALQRPIELGADIVVHSTTKYLNGHSDVVGGAVVSRSQALADEMGWWANCLGLTGSPFDSYLTLRGLRTLHARMAVHEENTRLVARALTEHAAVDRVFYPALSSHAGHRLARTQQHGFGGMLSFELEGGAAEVQHFVERLTHFSLAESLGGVESLVCHPATMTHASMPPAAQRSAGIGEGLVRLSVGIEHGDDLVADVCRALDAVHERRRGCGRARREAAIDG